MDRITSQYNLLSLNSYVFYAFKNMILRRGPQASPNCQSGPGHKKVKISVDQCVSVLCGHGLPGTDSFET